MSVIPPPLLAPMMPTRAVAPDTAADQPKSGIPADRGSATEAVGVAGLAGPAPGDHGVRASRGLVEQVGGHPGQVRAHRLDRAVGVPGPQRGHQFRVVGLVGALAFA